MGNGDLKRLNKLSTDKSEAKPQVSRTPSLGLVSARGAVMRKLTQCRHWLSVDSCLEACVEKDNTAESGLRSEIGTID